MMCLTIHYEYGCEHNIKKPLYNPCSTPYGRFCQVDTGYSFSIFCQECKTKMIEIDKILGENRILMEQPTLCTQNEKGILGRLKNVKV